VTNVDRAAVWIGVCWIVAVVITLWLHAAEVSESEAAVPAARVIDYTLHVSSGTALLVTTVSVAGYLRCAIVGARRYRSASLIGLLFAVPGLIAVPLTGNASQDFPAWLTMIAIGLHVSGVGVWVGGLGAIVALVVAEPAAPAEVLRRFSTLARCSIGTVALSGFVPATARLTNQITPPVPVLLEALAGTGAGWAINSLAISPCGRQVHGL
jgi:putative copper resistance protein D